MKRFLSCLSVLLLASPLVAQGTPPRLGPGPAAKPTEAKPLLASDGKAVIPGRIPEDTSESARELWEKLIRATTPENAASEPVTGFDLKFEVENKEPGQGNQSLDAHYKFLAEPGYLYCLLPRSKRQLMRGPQGDYLLGDGIATKLSGRQHKEDQRLLTEWVSIARNFVSLTNPEAVRIVSLEQVTDAGAPMPTEKLKKQAGELAWLQVKSPDFRLYQVKGPDRRQTVFRVRLGIRPQTGALELAVMGEDREMTDLHSSTTLVEIVSRTVVDGFKVPKDLALYLPEDGRRKPRGFVPRPRLTMWLKGGSLRAPLKPEDFSPKE